MTLVEIYKWKRYWPQVSALISSVEFCIAENAEKIADFEVENYPNTIELPTGFCSSNFSYSKDELKEAIEVNLDGKISGFERDYRRMYTTTWQTMLQNRENFPPDLDGRYSDSLRWLFLQQSVFSMLYKDHKNFLTEQVATPTGVNIDCFKSVLIQALAIFIEYCVQKKEGKASDVGDFLQLSIVPYVSLAVLDKERHNLIEKINRDGLFPTRLNSVTLSGFKKMVEHQGQIKAT